MKVIPLTIGAWNVRTLMDSSSSDRPERIQPVRRPQGKKVPKKLDVCKLKKDSKRQAFVNDLCSRLDALEHSSEAVDKSWTVFRDTVHSSAMDSLGLVSTPRRETPKIQGLPQKYQLSI